MYNIDKPPSYFQDGLKEHSELPTVHFQTNEFGNVIENNINYNIIENSSVELFQNQYIVRMKVKIFAEKLGIMSIIMDKIELKNNSYCYIYTTDYQVVAGPIYQKSIQDYLIIKNIPADELVIEVVANDLKDFNLNLKEVNYYSIVKQVGKSGKDKSQDLDMLLGANDSCHTCNDGVKSYADFIDNKSECNWLGYGNNDEIFKMSHFGSVGHLEKNKMNVLRCPTPRRCRTSGECRIKGKILC